ncbi:zeta toxin family protein [Mucilaginibacter terrae]|uniref:zeta toxin family protein n=1 Tax=Mucilaginibacter terrae TaxID=1955052 RepID=UPI0036328144
MAKPELLFVVGCNAAGKSSFIRTRINNLEGFEIIMTDVYKGRSKEIFSQALKQGKSIILETVFNDDSYKDLVDKARDAGYHTALIVLFLDSLQHSIDRVAFRSMEQNGLVISGSNIQINFNESFKNVACYFFYFDKTDFIYTGITGSNMQIMRFSKSKITYYKASDLQYPQKFAAFACHNDRLNQEALSSRKRPACGSNAYYHKRDACGSEGAS